MSRASIKKQNDGRSGAAVHKGRLLSVQTEPCWWLRTLEMGWEEGCAGRRGWVRRLVLKGRLRYEFATVDCIFCLFLRCTGAGAEQHKHLLRQPLLQNVRTGERAHRIPNVRIHQSRTHRTDSDATNSYRNPVT